MTNERLDGSGKVCRHCGEKIEWTGLGIAYIDSEQSPFCGDSNVPHEPAPAEQPRIIKPGDKLPSPDREYYAEPVAASPAAPTSGYTTQGESLRQSDASKSFVEAWAGASPAEGPRPKFLDWVRDKYPVLQNPILLNYGDSLTSDSMKGIDCATIIEEYANQFSTQPSPDAAKVEEIAQEIAKTLHVLYTDGWEKIAAVLRLYFPQVSAKFLKAVKAYRANRGWQEGADLDAAIVEIEAGLAGEATEGPKSQECWQENTGGSFSVTADSAPAAPEGTAPPDVRIEELKPTNAPDTFGVFVGTECVFDFAYEVDANTLHNRLKKALKPYQRATAEVRELRAADVKRAQDITRLTIERDDAVDWIRVLNEETVLAGFPGGDRNQTLANVREMRAAIKEAIGKEDEIRTLTEPYTLERGKHVEMVRDVVAQLRTARELVLEYGQHKVGCTWINGKCSCGFDAALSSPQSSGKGEDGKA